jgi:hypothetical protein
VDCGYQRDTYCRMEYLFELKIGNAKYDSGSCGEEHRHTPEVTMREREEQQGGDFGEAQFKKYGSFK